MSDRPLYSVAGLSFAYGLGQPAALSIPSLEIGEGCCLALLGPNGSGKTTFLKLLDDLLPAGNESTFSGEILFRGEPVRRGGASFRPRALRKAAVYMHQHPYVLSGSVAYNMAFACRARGMPTGEAAKAAEEALRMVGMENFAARRQRGLSGGEAQRLALARVIAAGAEVLLLDEPTASADSSSRDLIVEALAALAAKGTAIIFSTHEKDIVERIATRSLEFSRGLIASDSIAGDSAARDVRAREVPAQKTQTLGQPARGTLTSGRPARGGGR